MQGVRIVLATHGYFADGIKTSAQIIAGDVSHIDTLCCYVEDNVNYEQKIYELLRTHTYDVRPLLVITDLLGGSINTIFMKYLNEFPFQLISGLNLALLLECMMLQEINPIKLREIIHHCKDNITLCNDCLKLSDSEEDF